jgi:hypothetical protein
MTAPRRRRFRFSLRTLFAVVTVAAIALALWLRAQRLQVRSDEHLSAAINSLLESEAERAQERLAHSSYLRKVAAHHLLLSTKYQQAVWRPWAAYRPDPAKSGSEDSPGTQVNRP